MHQVAKDPNYSFYFWNVVDGQLDSKTGQSRRTNAPLEARFAVQDLKEKSIILPRDCEIGV